MDQGVEDLGPLSASFRDMQVDLRSPLGFTNVYRVPGQDDQFMRGSGGLFAVFPRSQYVPTRRGMLAQVPAGTVFYIGLPPAAAEPPPAKSLARDQRVEQARDTRVDRQIVTEALDEIATQPNPLELEGPRESMTSAVNAPPSPGAATAKTVATNDAFRARRISQLLERAAAAHLTRGDHR